MRLLEGSLLSYFPHVACYLITVESQDCRLWVLSAAEARGCICVVLKSAVWSSAQLALDASFPHSPDDFSRGHAHLIVPIDSLTQEATARAGRALLGVHWSVCMCCCTHIPSALCRSIPPTHCWTWCRNPQSIFKQNQNNDLEGTEKPEHVLSGCHFFPSNSLHCWIMMSTCEKKHLEAK